MCVTTVRMEPKSLHSPSAEEPFVHVRPQFKVVNNFSKLISCVMDLHQRKETIGSDFSDHSKFSAQGSSSTVIDALPAPRVLCFWDIDDTLVASGELGVRAYLMFKDHELRHLFSSFPGTRHLLLSQGSVDDVFASGGKLGFLKSFFLEPSAEDYEEEDELWETKPRSSSCTCFGGGDVKKPKPSVKPKGIPIHLTRVEGCRKELTCGRWSDWAPSDPESHPVRWMVLRPFTWGISLARLSSLVAPSHRTIFVDGKQFKKLDIVWSFAASGNWDRVFFIDNNLCEVGIIKYGMSFNNASALLSRNRADKVFLADFSLLRASEKLYVIEKQNGKRLRYSDEVQKADTKDGNASTHPIRYPTQNSPIKQVDLVVANLHFSVMDYFHVRNEVPLSRVGMLSLLSRQSGHPTFFEEQCCSDEQFKELIESIAHAESAIDQIIMEDLRLDGSVGNGWKRGWRPNSNKVIMPWCTTSLSVPIIKRLGAVVAREFLINVHVFLDEVYGANCSSRKMEFLSNARNGARLLYDKVWTEFPVVDAYLFFGFVTRLYTLYCSDSPPKERVSKELRKKAVDFLAQYDAEVVNIGSTMEHCDLDNGMRR